MQRWLLRDWRWLRRLDLGHGQFGKAPHLIELTPDKRVVWTFAKHQTMRTIASLQLLDAPGDVTRGQTWH